MRIAQIAPLWESVPPAVHGEAEQAISYLTEELIRQGHDVTLFASGDSITQAKLVSTWPESLRVSRHVMNPDAPLFALMERVFAASREFDLIHSHVGFLPFPLARQCRIPLLTTLYSRLDLPELLPLFRKFSDMPLVSLSEAQREPISWANWLQTIPLSLPRHLYTPHVAAGTYLSFLGRIEAGNGIEEAITAAARIGMPLQIGSTGAPEDRAYYDSVISPRLGGSLIQYRGTVHEKEKNDFLGHAAALFAPINNREPACLAAIEALACGTPVIAFRTGPAAECVQHGVTGFLCDTVEEMARSLGHIALLDRSHCRLSFETRFTVPQMAHAYLTIYEQLVATATAVSSGREGASALPVACSDQT